MFRKIWNFFPKQAFEAMYFWKVWSSSLQAIPAMNFKKLNLFFLDQIMSQKIDFFICKLFKQGNFKK